MRYLVTLTCALALVASTLSASAQEAQEGTTLEPKAEQAAPPPEPLLEEPVPPSESVTEEPVPSPESAPEEPALKLELDSAGVEVVPSEPLTVDGYTLEQMNRRVKRARIGLIVSIVPAVVGSMMVLGANAQCMLGDWTAACNRLENAGAGVASAGAAALIATGALLGVRKRKRRELREAHYGTPRRARWDLARSRVVF